MLRKIRELDFDAIVERISQATDRRTRTPCDALLKADLGFVHSRADALRLLRDHIALAALDTATALDDVRFSDPLIQAVIRVQHHPDALPIERFPVQGGVKGPDAGPRLRELVAAHPELAWSAEEIQHLIVRAIRGFGDHELDDEQPPWRMYWGPASAAAYALRALVTLRTLGDL
jgi:hypothetical protein